jgi:two-component system, NtrC family, sensor histidine kinase KinB
MRIMQGRGTDRELPTSLAPKGAPSAVLWRDLFELSQDGLALTLGAAHVVQCMNSRLCELMKQPRDRSSFRFGEVFRDVDLAMLDRAYASGVPETSGECEHSFPDGRVGCLVYTFSPTRDTSGGVSGLIVCVRDTTDQMLVRREFTRSATALRTVNERLVVSSVREQELAEAETAQRAQLNALLEKLSEGVIIAEPTGRITMLNGAARTILGVGRDELLTVDALDHLETQNAEGQPLGRDEGPLRRALRGQEFVDCEVLCLPPHGEPRRVVWTGTSVRDASGQVALAVVVFRDVTELRRLERQREEYTALISHDLRNPLGAVIMFSGVLRRSMQQKGLADDAHAVLRIERNAVRMKAMVEELVDATSLELHAAELQRVPFDLMDFVGAMVERLDEAQARRIAIEAEDESPYLVFADAPRLERCVVNLITNALKYSAEDSPVRIRLSRDRSCVVLDVIDRGIGIAPETAKRLFDRYYRSAGGKAHTEGLGLGLYIARLIVEAHGGRIEVLSEIGKGSTFKMLLPAPVESA